MIEISQISTGTIFEFENEIFQVIWFQHHKPGKGGAVMRTKIKNLRTSAIVEKTFRPEEKVKEVEAVKKKKSFLYEDGKNCFFMDLNTYEQISIPKEKIQDKIKFLKENTEVDAVFINEEFIEIELPVNVELKVISTVPGVKGDSVSNITKPATLETGLEISVPLFIKEGDIVKVDTRTSEYIERV